jgi:hypothetical protein
MVPRKRLELSRPFGHRYLKPARLPIPPPGHLWAALKAGIFITDPAKSTAISCCWARFGIIIVPARMVGPSQRDNLVSERARRKG